MDGQLDIEKAPRWEHRNEAVGGYVPSPAFPSKKGEQK